MIKSFLKFLKSKDFKEFLILFFSGLIIIALCILIYNIPVKASSGDNTAYFPMEQNSNGVIDEWFLTYIENNYDTVNNYFIIYGPTYISNYEQYHFVICPKTVNLYGEISNNGYQWTLYQIGSGSYEKREVKIQKPQYWYWDNQDYGFNWQNLDSNLYNTNIDYVSNFKIWTSNNEQNRGVVLKYGWDLPPDFFHNDSHATPPDTFESPIYTTGHTPPTNVPPTYTINNYTWTTYTPPTIDTSNAETLLQSIYNAIVYNGQYLKENIHGELTNLVDNIGGFFEYIGDTIQYYGNLIISNIQNGITTFYNNINSAIVGIGNAVGYITQPLDMDNLTNAVNSTHIWGDIGTCTSYANDAFGIYGTVAEPNTFKIPLDLRSISLLNITQVYYIDLSWLDGAKQAIRAFMWCVVTFGLLYSVIVDIPNMIRSSK